MTELTSGEGTRVVTDVLTVRHELDTLGPEWRALYRAAEEPTAPLSWEWAHTWWKVYARDLPSRARLQIVTVRRGGALIGVLPLYGTPRRWFHSSTLRFLSTGEPDGESTYPQNLDILAHPAERSVAHRGIEEWIALSLAKWERFDGGVNTEESALYEILRRLVQKQATARVRGALNIESNLTSTSFQADITGGIERYLSRLAPAVRRRLNRTRRELSREEVDFRVAESAEEAQRYFTELCGLHGKRWRERGESGAFAASRVIRFHRTMIDELATYSPKTVMLGRLSVRGAPAALVYGFRCGSRFEFYQSGIDVDQPIRSPGLLAHLAMMEHLGTAGVTIYDLLEGESRYKRELSTSTTKVIWPVVRMRTPLVPSPTRLRNGFARLARSLPRLVASR